MEATHNSSAHLKRCGRCKATKPATDFSRCRSRGDGLHTRCKECAREHYLLNRDAINRRSREYHARNRETLLPKQRAYWRATNDERLARQREYQAENKELIRAQQGQYRASNRGVIAERNKRAYLKDKPARAEYGRQWNASKWKSDPLFRLKSNLRTRTSAAIRRGGFTKQSGLVEVLGCDWDALQTHLSALLRDGMTWDNYGTEWVIDHHVPLASATDADQLTRLCHYTNLRPLTKTENLRKAARLPANTM